MKKQNNMVFMKQLSMIKTLFFILFIVFSLFTNNVAKAQQNFLPSHLPELKLWLAADSGVITTNGWVTQWNDLSGHQFNAVQTTATKRPLLIDSAFCGKPVIRFDGVNDWLYASFGQGFAQGNSFFAVWRISGTTGATQVCYSSSNISGRHDLKWDNNVLNIYAGNNVGYNKAIPFNYTISSVIYNQSNSRIYENGLLKSTGNAGNQGISDVFLGRGGWAEEGFLNGDIAEIIFFDEALHDTNRVKIENYLMNKYASQVSLPPDIYMSTLCDTIIEAHGCFNNYLWSTGATTPSIHINQPGVYWVMAVDMFNYLSVDSINVYYPLTAINNFVLCFGDTVSVNTGLQAPYTFLWNTLDTTSEIEIYNAGLYWVQVGDTLGCFVTDYFNVDVDSMAFYAGFASDTLILCSGDSIALDSGSNYVADYIWSNASTDSFLCVTAPGNYCVTLTSDNGCTAVKCVFVDMALPPQVDFGYYDSLCVNYPIMFYDISIAAPNDPIMSWIWDFGNGVFYTGQNVSFVYTISGNFDVTLTVTTLSGCTFSHTKTLYIAPVCITSTDAIQTNLVTFYPNPVADVLNIEWNGNTENIQFFIYNTLGQLVSEGSFAVKVLVNTSGFCSGVYLVKFVVENSIWHCKFIKHSL